MASRVKVSPCLKILNQNETDMRKFIFFTLFFSISTGAFSQQTNPKRPLTQQDYLAKSKNQKKVGWFLLGGGATFMATAFIIPRGELVHKNFLENIVVGPEYENDGIKAAFFITGGLSALSSIPFFVISKKNQRKAMSLALKTEKTIYLCKQNFVHTSIPAIEVRVNF
jgi:hypothetical protein